METSFPTHVIDRMLERLKSAGALKAGHESAAREVLASELDLDTLAADVIRADFWSTEDLFEMDLLTDDQNKNLEQMGESFDRAFRWIADHGLIAGGCAQIISSDHTDPVRLLAARDLLHLSGAEDRRLFFKQMVEIDPDHAAKYMDQLSDEEIGAISSEDITDLLTSMDPDVREQAIKHIPRLSIREPEDS